MTRSTRNEVNPPSTPRRNRVAQPATPPSSPKKASTCSTPTRSPRSPINPLWVQEQKKREFLEHLQKWSLDYDSSPHFHGNLSLVRPAKPGETFELGNPVTCILAGTAGKDSRKQIIIRLFAPKKEGRQYRLLIRSGAGWVAARDYFEKQYFTRWKIDRKHGRFDRPKLEDGKFMSGLLGPISLQDSVTIRPLFLPFSRLPGEIQQLILEFAVGKQQYYRPAIDNSFGTYVNKKFVVNDNSLIRLPTLFSISKALNRYLVPWIYRTTNFSFECAGFTNFLWLSGPTNRSYVNKITLAFGQYALLHCLRWFVPAEIFVLLEPPLHSGLQYYWRCQIQDLIKELHLSALTIDIHRIPSKDLPFVIRVLSQSFGSVDKLQFSKRGDILDPGSIDLQNQTWCELIIEFWGRYRNDWHFYFGDKVREGTEVGLVRSMQENWEFFGKTGVGKIRRFRANDLLPQMAD